MMKDREQFVISGISGRYPESRNLDEFWTNLLAGKDFATIDGRRWSPSFPNIPPRMAKILDAELFDAEFFKISPDSSNKMYVCLRILHEVIYEALIDAGLQQGDWQGTKTGISLGASVLVGNFDTEDTDSSFIESALSYLSYSFNFNGPVIHVDTACAASSSALDIAIQKMLVGECDQMIVAAYNFCANPMIAASFASFGMTNMEGKSKCLDANADGYCRSESIVAMLVQRESAAKRIYGSLTHVATNCDGYTEEGITFPRYDAQYKLLKSLFQDLKLNPLDINYVEGHITGTQVGDPVECESIFETVRPNSEKPLLIGCLKSNIGHAEGSATLNSISKVVKIFQTGLIPANLHYKEPNPKIDGLIKGILKPVLTNTKFEDNLILVNSFGFGGVNNSFVLEANSKRLQNNDFKLTDENNPRLVLICNRTPSGLDSVVEFLNEQKGSITKYTLALLNNMSKITPSMGFNHRGYLLLNDEQTIIHKTLKQNLSSEEMSPWFLFTTMFDVSSQSFNHLMNLPLINSRLKLMQTKQLTSHGINVIKIIESNQQDLTNFLISSIAIQIALCDLLVKHLGIKPKGIIGHSIGLIAAAYADNCITDEDALLIGYHIGEACKQFKGQGAMVYVNLPWEQVEKIKSKDVEIASHESKDWTMVTGKKDSVDDFISNLDSKVNVEIIDTKQIPFNSSLLSYVSRLVTAELEKFLKVLKVNSQTLKSTCCLQGMDSIPENQSIGLKLFTDFLKFPCNLHEIQQQLPPDSLVITFGSSDCSKLQHEDQKMIHLINSNGTKLSLSHYKSSILSLYTAIGDLYLQGLNPKIENLYDPVEYPVPRETQSIAHLIKWKHDVQWFISYYTGEKTLARIIVPVELIDPNWRFLEGHKVDGRILFPATGYLHVAWKLLCLVHHCVHGLQPIEFHQVQFLRATQLKTISSTVTFKLKYNRDAGTFLIWADDKSNICVTGKYHLVNKPSIYFNRADSIYNSEEHQELILKKEDIYKEFRIRGYDYTGAFQGIEEASVNGEWAKIKDSGNWISFADACCQTVLLTSRALKTIVPIFMDYIYMDPTATEAAFKDQSLNSATDSVNCLTVYHNSYTGVIQSKGLIIKGMVGQELKRRMTIASVQITIQQNMSLDRDHELPVDIKEIQESYTSYCMKLIEILKEWRITKQFNLTEENDKDLESIEQLLSRNGESHTLLRILNETIKLIQNDQTNLTNHDAEYKMDAKLDEIYKQYADCLLKDCLFMQPLESLFGSMVNIIRHNEKLRINSLVLINFLVIPSETDIVKRLTPLGYVYTPEYAVEDKFAYKLSADSDFIKIDSTQNTRINETESYDVAVIRDKSTYLMMKDGDDENEEFKCNQFESILQSTFNSLKEGGFCLILTRTKLSQIEQEWTQLIGNQKIEINFDEESIKSIADNIGFTFICCKELKSNGFWSILLRRPLTPSSDQKISFIRVNLKNLDWIEKIKETAKDKNHKIWLIGGGYDNGIIGMVKCLKKENYNLNCYFDPSKGDDEEIIVPDEVLIKDLVINHVDSYGSIGVYENIPIDLDEFQVETTCCYADSKSKGDLSSLRWFQSAHSKWTHIPKEKLKRDHDKVTIYYGSLNFKDVLIATGRFPVITLSVDSETVKATAIGLEYSGIDESGRRVMGLCDDGGISTSLVAYSSYAKIQVPDEWTLAEAATVPVVYLTAYYGLITRGNMRNGESVLIHAGSGGVGQAAISICLARGCEVFTTVGTQEKRDFIKNRFPSIDDDHIGDSRSTSFEEMVMRMTNGRGVDLVLNSLSDDKLTASVRCLTDFGRFIEIGKYDMVQNTKMNSNSMDFNKTFHACCLAFLQDEVLRQKVPERIRVWNQLLVMLNEGIRSGEVVPLPSTIFQMNQLEESFRFMATGKHIGKVLIQMRDETEDPNVVKLYPAIGQTFFDLEKSYIITGGLGGLGLEVAFWMVQRGATNLILTSRSGVKTKYQEYMLDRIRNNNYTRTNVLISHEDCYTYESAERLINQAKELGPIGGIIFSAMVLDDTLFENRTAETFKKVVYPKAIACRHLDKCTRSLPYKLDYFVGFSSIANEFGNVGQDNYCYGNAAVENICYKRHLDGHHGLAIRWGPIGDVGVLADFMAKLSEKVQDFEMMKLPLVLQLLDQILITSEAIYTAFIPIIKVATITKFDSLEQRIINILGIKDVKKIDSSMSLNQLGLDSLMAFEIRHILETDHDFSLTVDQIRSLKISEIDDIQRKFKKLDQSNLVKPLKRNIDHLTIPTTLFVPLNKIQTGSSRYFYFPDINGTHQDFESVAELVSMPVVGVNYVKDLQSLNSIENIVDLYVNSLLTTYPHEKSFNLIGHSFGGAIALKVAIALQTKTGISSCQNLIILISNPEIISKIHENPCDQKLDDKLLMESFRAQFNSVYTSEKIQTNLLSFSNDEKFKYITKIISETCSSLNDSIRVEESFKFYSFKHNLDLSLKHWEKFSGDITLIRVTETMDDTLYQNLQEYKLSDFGLSKFVDGQVTVLKLPCSPESFMEHGTNQIVSILQQ